MDSIQKGKYAVYKAATGIIGGLQGPLKDSRFLEKGVLTPEEFVLAGDHLCNKCGTWQWQAAVPNQTNKNLPPDKQFLVTRGVPCEKRIADLQKFHQDNADELERDAEDGWVETINPE